jgi:hypothetical protein
MSVSLILNALVAIPQIVGLVESFASAVVSWYCQRANAETLSAISDAADLSANAKTEADYAAASEAWNAALNRSKLTP